MSETENPAETLRRAAALMRERAEDAVCSCGGPVCTVEHAGVRHDEMTARFDDWTRVVDHYVGMTPAVALAVADTFDALADLLSNFIAQRNGTSPTITLPVHRAIAAAHAYLGTRP